MRTTKELLIILRDNLKDYFTDLGDECNGMCILIEWLQEHKVITFDEKYKLRNYLSDNRPISREYYISHYWWKRGSIPPRLRWLNKQIEKL